MRKLLIVRPEPGASLSAERARILGLDPTVRPLFAIEPVEWTPPDPARFDALLLTSANAARHAGAGLTNLATLPVIAVGGASAQAAREAGLTVTEVGTGDVQSVLSTLPADWRLLHLGGEHRRQIDREGSDAIIVYRAVTIADPQLPNVSDMVVAVHSPRAGKRFAELIVNRGRTSIAAISEAAACACCHGWRDLSWASVPGDEALLALAARLCQSPAS
ncbi:MAG TPA: uroporphyrinogen-III synthase [Sphingomicrobium sp.]|nr:uroporphyrinogen-III synthase [Sphingomicrobium sp.]